jgi:hypothetical protein
MSVAVQLLGLFGGSTKLVVSQSLLSRPTLSRKLLILDSAADSSTVILKFQWRLLITLVRPDTLSSSVRRLQTLFRILVMNLQAGMVSLECKAWSNTRRYALEARDWDICPTVCSKTGGIGKLGLDRMIRRALLVIRQLRWIILLSDVLDPADSRSKGSELSEDIETVLYIKGANNRDTSRKVCRQVVVGGVCLYSLRTIVLDE